VGGRREEVGGRWEEGGGRWEEGGGRRERETHTDSISSSQRVWGAHDIRTARGRLERILRALNRSPRTNNGSNRRDPVIVRVFVCCRHSITTGNFVVGIGTCVGRVVHI
jgi:hypothetical protein